MNDSKKIQNRFLALAIVITLVALGYFIWSTLFFRISSVSPRGKNLSHVTPYVDITFNKRLGNNSSSQISGTNKIIKSVEIKDKSIRVFFNSLEINTKYTITLSNIVSSSNDSISKTINFTAKDIDYSKLPSDQKKILIDNQDQERAASDPILANVPYGGEHFSLEVSPTNNNGESSVHLIAKLLLSRADLSDKEAVIESYKNEVAEYIQSIGLDINKYSINYEVIEPSIY